MSSPFNLPVEAVNLTLGTNENQLDLGWVVCDSTKRIIAPYLNEAQAKTLADVLNKDGAKV